MGPVPPSRQAIAFAKAEVSTKADKLLPYTSGSSW
jgi:hypothetical protein